MIMLEYTFWIGLGIVFYSYLGYGLVLAVLVRFKRMIGWGNRTLPEDYTPTVALIVPCFNEEGYIEEKIRNSLALDYPEDKRELIFISDGSNDRTAELVRAFTDQGITALHEDVRAGKAAAMNRAITHTEAEIVVFSDANTDLNPEALRNLCRHYAWGKVGAVAGQKRIYVRGEDGASGAGEGFYWKYESKLKQWDSQLYTVVGAAGELMSYRRELYQPLPPDTLLDDFMQSMGVCEAGYRVRYESGAVATETASANVTEELKRKVRIAAGGWQSMFRLKKAGNPFFNPILWFQYVSHRVLRWSLAPLLLPVLLALNLLLWDAGIVYQFLAVCQVAFYGAAAIGWLLESRSIRLKAVYIPYYFCVMNYAVYAGFLRFWKGGQSVLWERAKRG